MPSLLKGKQAGSMRPLLTHLLIHPLSLQQILAPLMSSPVVDTRTALLVQEGWRGGRVSPQGASGEVRSGQAKGHADMRLTCGSPVVGCVLAHLKLLLAARGPPKPVPSPGPGVDGASSSEFCEFR
jgi:hypothetical protein